MRGFFHNVFYLARWVICLFIVFQMVNWPWWGQLLTLVIGVPIFYFWDVILGIEEPIRIHGNSQDDDPSGNDNVNRNFYDYM